MWDLFLMFLKIGSFTFGGGYAMIPLIENEIVYKRKLLTSDEFIDYLSIAQSYPGVLGVNIAVMVGYRLYGFTGATLCVLASIFPAFIVVVGLSIFYFQNKSSKFLEAFFFGVAPVVISLLLFTFTSMVSKLPKTWVNILLLIMSFVAVGVMNISPIYVILAGGVLSLCLKF